MLKVSSRSFTSLSPPLWTMTFQEDIKRRRKTAFEQIQGNSLSDFSGKSSSEIKTVYVPLIFTESEKHWTIKAN